MDATTVTRENARGALGRSPFVRVVVRLALVVIAAVAMWFAQDRYAAFLGESSGTFRWNNELWIAYGAALVVGGLAFGLAVWMPFGKVRYMPSRLAFAAIALIPFLKTSLLLIELETGRGLANWWSTTRWFEDPAIVAAATALAGVAIAAGLRSNV